MSSNNPEDIVGRKEPSGQAAYQVSKGTDISDPSIGTHVNGFAQLYPRQVTIHTWRVLSTRNDNVTAHKVDLLQLNCTCGDQQYNKEDPQVCDHVAVAIHAARQHMDVSDALAFDLSETLRSSRDVLDDIVRLRTGLQADVSASEGGSEASTTPAGPEPDVDAVAAAERLQAAYDDLVEDMQVKAHEGIVWVQTGQDTPDDWPFPGGNDTWAVLLKEPEHVQYVGKGGDEYDEHKWYSLKPGKWWKNAIAPDDVDDYIDEVLG